MLRHTGDRRTNAHNLKLAGLLSLTAGFVNAAGFLSFLVLTTNVTGHVAIFAERLAFGDYHSAWIVGVWMLMFFMGAFVSGVIIKMLGRHQRFAYTLPLVIEMIILLMAAIHVKWFEATDSNDRFTSGSLLFAMGLQNATVSMISGSVVRTTHLTGMFTDLGIELAGSVYNTAKSKESSTLYSKIFLRLVIIGSFFTGCVTSAYCYHFLNYKTFYVPVALLLTGILFDISRIRTRRLYHKLKYNSASGAK
jgi:uncharacterized membrane protein YoaK (UPF0700 family)